MPLPVIVGIPALIGAGITIITNVLSNHLAKKALNIALFAALMTALYVALQALGSEITAFIASVDMSLPSSFGNWINFMIPSNFTMCLTALISFELAAITYKLSIKVIELKSRMLS